MKPTTEKLIGYLFLFTLPGKMVTLHPSNNVVSIGIDL